MNSSYGPVFLASTPILHSDRTGPSQGTIIFGRMFDPKKIRRLATQAGLELRLSPHALAKTGNRTSAFVTKSLGRLKYTPLKIIRSDDKTRIETTLFSIDDKPILDMTVSMPSSISKRGQKTLDTIIWAICVAGLVLSLVLVYVLNPTVTAPISRITEHLTQIRNQDDLTARIQLNREDEVGDLANEFDQMLERLSDTRKKLFDQSYQTGANEMASSVMQEINKSIAPLRENIELPISLLDRAHTSTSANLIHELADSKFGSHRYIEITQQLMDLNNEQALILAEARSEMRRLRINAEQLQHVISDYSKFNSQDTDVVSVADLLDAATKKLSPDERSRLSIDIDAGIYRSATVAASKNLLQQAINVLIMHFVKAAQNIDSAQLTLRVTCRTELSEGITRVHFCFDDNRPRMNEEQFTHYIAEYWSAKEPDTLGLAWAENAITSMQGRLFVEPSQLLDGIAINLVLLRAKPKQH